MTVALGLAKKTNGNSILVFVGLVELQTNLFV